MTVSPTAGQARELLQGAFDLQVHLAPDALPRALDAIDMALACRRLGMGGFLAKDHLTVTSDRAVLVEKAVPGVKVFGAVVLNHSVGGLNPQAAAAACALGARMVFLPTFCAEHDIRSGGSIKGAYAAFVPPQGPPGIRVLRADGSLDSAIDPILEIVRDAGAVLGTGHVSPAESLAVVQRARVVGVRRVVVTHVNNPIAAMTPAQQLQAAALGAVIEHSYLPCLRGAPVADVARDIREVGAARCILSTDLGQQGHPVPTEGLARFIEALLQAGVGAGDIASMVVHIPRRLMGLE